MVYLYGMEAFALAIVVHCAASRSARWLYQMLIVIAVSMLGVLINANYTPRPSNLASILERLAKAPYSHTATQPQIKYQQ
jgi:autotransporter translocation and assembly factor TamB